LSRGPRIDGRSFAAAQAFVLEAKLFWTQRLYPALRAEYDARAAAAEKPPDTAGEAAALVADSALYRWFAWLERHLQRMKYSGRYGLQPWHDQDRAALAASLDPAIPRKVPPTTTPRSTSTSTPAASTATPSPDSSTSAARAQRRRWPAPSIAISTTVS
jgi:hypothetical protein